MNINSRLRPPDPIYRQILDQIWLDAAAWPELTEAMQRALIPEPSQASISERSPHLAWRRLPMLCCQAAGGDPRSCLGISLAWGLLFTAAHLMDNVADGDEVSAGMADLGPGSMVNIATALYASAGLALIQESGGSLAIERTLQIERVFNHTILRMCSGQHLDLLGEPQDLETCWEIVRAKSGAIFELACRSGAQTASADVEIISHYAVFGNHLGIMVQICDDTCELLAMRDKSRPINNYCSIPIAYTMEMLPEEDLQAFQNYLQNSHKDTDSCAKAVEMVEGAGATLYMRTKLQYHAHQAMNALEAAGPNSSIREELAGFVKQLL